MVIRTLRVLVVDDDELVARAVARALRAKGHTVQAVHSAAEARALDHCFDAAVLDINLGDGSGIDLAAELLDACVVHSVTFFSGSTDPNERLRSADYGSFVQKTDGVDELVGALHEAAMEAQAAAKVCGAEGLAATQSGQHRPVTGARRKPSGSKS